jgi:hypothetical protein
MKKSLSDTVDLWNFGIPAFRSVTGLKTCPNAGRCAVGCYARSGAYRFSNVARAFEARLAETLKSTFVDTVSREISQKIKPTRQLYIRIHDSGDFYDLNYFKKWLQVAEAFPTVKFYAYTKQVTMIKQFGPLPANLLIIFSRGGLQDSLIKSTDRHSRVFETSRQLRSAGYTDTTDDDLRVFKSAKIGLVYHGNKNYSNTKWSET